ncbi:MAG: adenylate/guanylate cyclase domain-containing protein [Spirochaetales bacterium]|nr:adenylate/guanylate cyclase domain-containing protein [Spirochaetales bacterium]
MFTDIVGSTALWETYPESMSQAIARHDKLLYHVIESNGGYVFKTVGDAFCAAFSSAQAALRTAISIRETLAAEPWSNCTIRIRTGIHTGTAEERNGDYFGTTLNRTARIMSAGSGDQILLSAATRELLGKELPFNIRLCDLGLKRLKDLSAPQHIWQVDQETWPSEYPPLRALDSWPNNLPFLFTTFIGREKEISEITKLLSETRLVTIHGPGGTGKTRLVLECTAELTVLCTDGAWFVDLSRIDNGRQIGSACLHALGMPEDPVTREEDALVSRLREAKALVILDNCEHVIDECASFAETLLKRCERLRILATSRESLMVQGERTYRLDPLAVPVQTQDALDIHTLSRCDAVRLFSERAAETGTDFRLDCSTAPFVVDICARLNGLPLALELAAAQLRFMTIKDLADRLQGSFEILKSTYRTTPQRQKTLTTLLDWSWQLLDESEKSTWRRLSLFKGGFSAAAIDAVAGRESRQALEALVQKSIVKLDASPDAEGRYSMFDIIRRYGLNKLQESNDRETALSEYFAYYIRFTESLRDALAIVKDAEVFAEMAAELTNLRFAYEIAINDNRHLSDATEIFINLFDYYGSGHANIHDADNIRRTLWSRRELLSSHVQGYLLAADIRIQILRFAVSDDLLTATDKALVVAHSCDDRLLIARIFNMRTEVNGIMRNCEQSARDALQVLDLFQQDHNDRQECEAYVGLGMAISSSYWWGPRINLREIAGDRAWYPVKIDCSTGLLELSSACLHSALLLAEKIGDMNQKAWALFGFSEISRLKGEVDVAKQQALTSLALFHALKLRHQEWQLHLHLADLCTMSGDRRGMFEHVEICTQIDKEIGSESLAISGLLHFANYEIHFAEWDAVERICLEGLESAGDESRARQLFLLLLAVASVEKGAYKEAEKLLFRSIAMYEGKSPTKPDALSSFVAVQARIRLVTNAAPEESARAAGALLAYNDRNLPKLTCDNSPSKNSEWKVPETIEWARPWEFHWDTAFLTRRVLMGLLQDVSGRFEPGNLAELLNEGRKRPLKAFASEYFQVEGLNIMDDIVPRSSADTKQQRQRIFDE